MWILPTRSRPRNLRRAIENYPEAPIQVWFTQNDPMLGELQEIELPEAWTHRVASADSTVPEILNQAFEDSPNEPSYGFIGDDVVPPQGTPWWAMLDWLAQPIFFSYPTDSIHGVALAPHFCIGGELVRAVGWLAPPWYHHNWIDTTWFIIARSLGVCRIAPDLHFEHLHPLNVQSHTKDDPIYELGRSHYSEDEEKFKKWLKSEDRYLLLSQVEAKLNAV